MRRNEMFKIGAVWKWLKQNHKSILIFFTILAMGAGIAPTIMAGQRFVEALQFEKMTEASPAYAVVRDVESQTRFYVLSMEELEGIAVLWVLPPGNDIFDDKLDSELYIMFASLAENYDIETKNYIIIVAGPTVAPTPLGLVTAFHGMGYFTMTAEGAEQFVAAGAENAHASLETLYEAGEFDAQSLEEQSGYMTNLLPREPDHIRPWEGDK